MGIGFAIVLTVAGLVFGALMIFIPPSVLLKHDRMTGYRIYKKTFERSHNHDKATQNAGVFYKFFGFIFIVHWLVFLSVMIVTSR